MRSYTLEEIDRMRKALFAEEWDAAWGWYSDYSGPAEPVKEFERSMPSVVEDKLRTYMAAGIDPAELEKRGKQSSPAAGDSDKSQEKP